MLFNPHKLGVHKVLKHIPLNALFDAPYKRALKKAVNIADLRLIAKARSHKVRFILCDLLMFIGITVHSIRSACLFLSMHLNLLGFDSRNN